MGARIRRIRKTAPGEGERNARRGYVHQDRASARLIYEALADRSLRWVGLADREAGVADDLVLGLADAVVAHQFKRTRWPSALGLTALLLGKESVVADLAASYEALRRQFSETVVRLRYLTNHYPSTGDRLIKRDSRLSTAAFVGECVAHPGRSLAEWRATSWASVINALVTASGLAEADFEQFWMHFDLVMGARADLVLDPTEDADRRAQIEDLARALSTLLADNPDKNRWSRNELLDAIDWPDRFALRFTHTFPVGAYVQRNEATEARLLEAIATHTRGYVALVGPPGAGKSTLLQRELRDQADVHVLRYLAFVPGAAQGQGRGEADSFYDDLNSQFVATGLKALRVKDDTTLARQQEFAHLLALAGERNAASGLRYLIVVDGLDHIPREERPEHSLLAALPLPQSVPDGVIFVLGTQRLDLDFMLPAVRDEAGVIGRRIDVTPLSAQAVAAMADALKLPREIPREEIYRLTGGHALVTRYLIERLISADPVTRSQLLAGEHGFGGDLEAVYDAAWRTVEQAPHSAEVKRVLALIAHADARVEPQLLAKATSDAAVEDALQEVGHLLDCSALGWSMFHNSFRLFVQRKPVLRFGVPDPNFAPNALYRTLANLTHDASPKSPQRWLTFRYLYLAGDIDGALALADRRYFVQQYCQGRSARAVHGDISDAFRALKTRADAIQLFELMLADDEVERRAAVMEGASSLVDAYLAVGDAQAARALLEDTHEDGKQWLVVDALLSAGETEQARKIFEDSARPQLASGNATFFAHVDREATRLWAQRAVLFLDESQLDRYISGNFFGIADGREESKRARNELAQAIKFEIARAYARVDADFDLERVATHWGIRSDERPIELAQENWTVG